MKIWGNSRQIHQPVSQQDIAIAMIRAGFSIIALISFLVIAFSPASHHMDGLLEPAGTDKLLDLLFPVKLHIQELCLIQFLSADLSAIFCHVHMGIIVRDGGIRRNCDQVCPFIR